jgi:hypothetical protein
MPLALELDSVQPSRPITGALSRWRRKLIGRVRRWSRWEFWPPYVFYPPVIAYIACLGFRFRSFTLFTAANPAMPAGGFVGESKHEILGHLKSGRLKNGHLKLGQVKNGGSFLPLSILLREGTPDDRVEQAEAFMQRHQLGFPIVLKPDAGQRGSGVAIVRSSQQLREYICRASFSIIVQEHVPGREFGVFYVRYPDEKRGRIFSVTEKRMPVVVGNGSRTLEELILEDDRAVCMADYYLRHNSERADDVPAGGERVQLVEIGTHCRGAIFLDGSYAITPALEESIDRIAKTFDGFFFGRFDIRVPTVEDFMAGKNLKVIELNGVTSEATHIYDPKLSLFHAYRVLFKQWRIAFEIGNENRKRGAQSSSVKELMTMIRDYGRLAEEYPT